MKTLIILFLLSTASFAADLKTPYDVCYSPRGGCQEMLVNLIDKADEPIYVMAYNFTSDEIGDALVRARKRGVQVNVIVDFKASLQKGQEVDKVSQAGGKVWTDKSHKIFHDKIIIIGNIVQTGSYNYTANAEVNAENAIILWKVPELAQKYLSNWKLHQEHSIRFGK